MRLTGRSGWAAALAVLAVLGAGGAAVFGMSAARAASGNCPTVDPGTGVVTATAGVDWSGCDLVLPDGTQTILEGDLDNANLSGANLTGVKLGTSLTGTDFAGAELSGAQLTAGMDGANFTGANLAGAVIYYLRNSNLSGADISRANFNGAQFQGIKSGGLTDLGGQPSLPFGWSLSNGFLIGPSIDLSGLDYPSLGGKTPDLSSMTFNGSNFSSANLTGATINQDYISGSKFVNTNLTGANLSADRLYGDDLDGAIMTGAQILGVESFGITGTPAKLPADWTLVGGYLLGPYARLGSSSPDLSGDDLSGVDLHGADLANASFADANLTGANLDGAKVSGATFTGATWSGTTCPDGTNSGNDGGTCANNINDQPPTANPVATGTGPGQGSGWFTKATITWNWSDVGGTIDPARCPATTTTTAQGDPATITASCTNTVGASGSDTIGLDLQHTGPAVAVTGVAAGRVYAAGHLPAVGCRTTDAISGVAKKAKLTIAASGRRGLGAITATCAGAANNAGIAQAAPVRVKFIAAPGLSAVLAPKNKSTVARSAKSFTVSFRLDHLTAAAAAALASQHAIRVTLGGPSITAVTVTATWHAKTGTFSVKVPIPAKVRKATSYTVTIKENVGTGLVSAPPLGHTLNPQTIRFS